MKKNHTFMLGFHFIEILIGLVLLSLLATISLPIYTRHLIHERRLEAASMLTQLAIAMEDYHLQFNTYSHATFATLHFPEWAAQNNYKLMIRAVTEDHYQLIAKPQGQQARKDRLCGSLLLDSLGEKSVSGSKKWEECW